MDVDGPEGTALPALEAALARGLARLDHPPAEWTPELPGPDGRPAPDVLIAGAGMNGLAAAFALRRLGIGRIRQVDARPAGQEGPWLEQADAGLVLRTGKGAFAAEEVILGTGFRFDLSAAPELGGIADRVLLWRDLDHGTDGPADEYLDCPALGPGFEFRPRPGADPAGLARIRCLTHAAQASLGNLANDIPQVSDGADRLARAIARDMFVEDAAHHRARLFAYAEPELLGDEYTRPID
jgi:cation diffusion facilitator CzcD-associated flavoprotein CzcO